MAKSDELIKYITARVVTYIDTPRDERRRSRESARVQRGKWEVRWFGMMPLAASMWLRSVRRVWLGMRRSHSGRDEDA